MSQRHCPFVCRQTYKYLHHQLIVVAIQVAVASIGNGGIINGNSVSFVTAFSFHHGHFTRRPPLFPPLLSSLIDIDTDTNIDITDTDDHTATSNSIHKQQLQVQDQQQRKQNKTNLGNDDPNDNPNPNLIGVSIDDEWFDLDLSKFHHPGGEEVLRRHHGQDITNLFYSNHWEPLNIHKNQLLKRKRKDANLNKDENEKVAACPFSSSLNSTGSKLASSQRQRRPDPNSALYQDLKHRVKSYLDSENIEWRHQPNYNVFFLRGLCLAICICSREFDVGSVSINGVGAGVGTLSAMVYGILTGRMVWTHVHNAVHNPSSVPPRMRQLMELDCVAVVSLWMHEHLTHHAETNTSHDPDMFYFSPLFDYESIARIDVAKDDTSGGNGNNNQTSHTSNGGSTKIMWLAILCAYPLLVPFMLIKSILHANSQDAMLSPSTVASSSSSSSYPSSDSAPTPGGSSLQIWYTLLILGPLRFGFDVWAMGGIHDFSLALFTATAYIVLTFAATHQIQENHNHHDHDRNRNHNLSLTDTSGSSISSSSERNLYTSSNDKYDSDWMVDQMRSTNGVWSESKLYSTCTGGISNHVEHHIFPHISGNVLVEIAPIVKEFAREYGLEYYSFSPLELVSRHLDFIGGKYRAEGRLGGAKDEYKDKAIIGD